MHKYATPTNTPRPIAKGYRQSVIRSLIRDGSVRNQAEMQRYLRRAGIRVTQSTLSRDLKNIGLVKGASGYREADDEMTPAMRLENMEKMVRSYLSSVARTGNLVVMKTPAGLAHALGVAIDNAALPEVMGTVAGDDTLFVAAPDPRNARDLVDRLRGLIGRR